MAQSPRFSGLSVISLALGAAALAMFAALGRVREHEVAPGDNSATASLSAAPLLSREALMARTNDEWKKVLTPLQYHVTREKGTERPFANEYCDEKRSGVYECVCCGQPLFHSSTKFDSGTGWPSFYEPANETSVRTEEDRNLFFQVRTEVLCSRCDAHLGHVFPDGPEPTGLRYCMNSASLRLKPDEEKKE